MTTTLFFESKEGYDVHSRISAIIKQVRLMRNTIVFPTEREAMTLCIDRLVDALGYIEDLYAEIKEE